MKAKTSSPSEPAYPPGDQCERTCLGVDARAGLPYGQVWSIIDMRVRRQEYAQAFYSSPQETA